MGLLALPSQLIPLDADIGVIVLLIGLAVGVDYSLFYLKREREERAAGRSERAALEAAAATSGRSVLISGLTVMVAMAGMLFTGDKTFMGFGVATMIVVAIAVLGSLTVLPALLAALGDKVDKLRVPFLHRLRRADGGGRIWSAILDRVLRRPLVSVVARRRAPARARRTGAAHAHRRARASRRSRRTSPSVKTYNKLQKAFPGEANSAQVLVKTDDAHSPAVTAAIAELKRQAIATGQFSTPTRRRLLNADGTIAVVSIAMQGDGVDDKALTALADAAQDGRPRDRRQARRRRRRRHRHDREAEGLERPDEARRAVRVRVRAHARLPADAADVPLGRDRDQGGAAQPALGRRRLRRPGARVPARLGQGPARLRRRREGSSAACRSSSS